ncbi:glucose-induced degradation protein 4 [Chaetomidium leptoderma]|uniref:Glucose-induced degradation protein 4 n=1 Tax=Chaetomidium leptoderma TaxID=669021 RepID=A0AAN6ZYL6_9PEZI|nr:glucose-induced degradation protein 4 [Chaetomidium leptoderma]
MPTPSSNAPDPPSSRLHPFWSCPDPDEEPQQPSQPASEAATSPEPPSPSSWRPPSPPSDPADHGPRANPNIHDDSRSVTMSPGPQPEDATRDVDMGHEPEGMMIERDDVVGERHKPAHDADVDMSRTGDDTTRGDPVGGGGGAASGSRGGGSSAQMAIDGTLGRRKSKTEQVSPVVGGETHEVDVWDPAGKGPRWVEDSGLVGLGLEYSHMRVITTAPSLYFQTGSRFLGTQQSERQRYDVDVEIKHVDMRESFLCGYLRIQGLTDDHPTLTTYFEGEIIGSKYGFITQHEGWGATEKIDLSHWSKFTAFRPYLKQARKGGKTMIQDVDQRENIFMRWKEHFLVPDHRVRTINGASFEGFYYICFNQVRGEVSGIYFHSKSEKFQQLELKHFDTRGCFSAMEFR